MWSVRSQESRAGCCRAWWRAPRRALTLLLPGLAHSTERAPVTLHLDGIVQVLNCHLSDMAIGMMTRIAVLKWLYHLYIKTPRKVSPQAQLTQEAPPSQGLFLGPPWFSKA